MSVNLLDVLIDTDRHQIVWINQRHISEAALDEAITTVINGYNRFLLPSYWGSSERASADGTKWDLYEQNLLSEYHIRYGDYGGIAYFVISAKYVALFSHFIPCGLREAIYILDGLMENKSEIQPDIIHPDSHGQSESVFGLVYLLGINWRLRQFCADSVRTIVGIDSTKPFMNWGKSSAPSSCSIGFRI